MTMIRKYTDTDTDALIEIWAKSDAIAHPFLPQSVKDQVREDMRTLFLPNAETWVLEMDGKPIGFIAMLGDEIGGLFLDPSHHRKGFGRKMVDHVARLKRALTVEVFKDNEIGLNFYHRYGFTRTAESVFEPSGHATFEMALPAS